MKKRHKKVSAAKTIMEASLEIAREQAEQLRKTLEQAEQERTQNAESKVGNDDEQ